MAETTQTGTRTISFGGVKIRVSAAALQRHAAIKGQRAKSASGTRGRKAAPWREVLMNLNPMDEVRVPYTQKDATEKATFQGFDMPSIGGVKSGCASVFNKTGRVIIATDMGDGTCILFRADDGNVSPPANGEDDDADDTE